MLAAERRNEILSLLKNEGKVIVSDLSKTYDVTEETIRRDLEKLEKDGFAERTYGGAVIKENDNTEFPYLVRKRFHVNCKQNIAYTISNLIEDGDRIMLDASTTALFVAKQIKNKKDITVITNSIEVLIELSEIKGWKVLSTGGALRAGGLSLVGYQAERMVDSFHVDKTIVSCKGFDLERGFTDSNELDAQIKSKMLRAASMKIMAVDSSKFGKISFTQIAELAEIDMIATDVEPAEEWLQKLASMEIAIKV